MEIRDDRTKIGMGASSRKRSHRKVIQKCMKKNLLSPWLSTELYKHGIVSVEREAQWNERAERQRNLRRGSVTAH